MRRFDPGRMRLVFVGFVAAMVLGAKTAKADYTWTQKSDMPTPRSNLTSAVVNGKIYVIGGATSQPNAIALTTVEEYDPATDMWRRKADMPIEACDFSGSSAVVDARIYVIGVGGLYALDWSRLAVQEYDPSTDTWARKADMPTQRWMFATVDFEGKVYVIGGYPPGSWAALTTVEMYDPATDTWTSKADMPMGLALQNARVVNGKIYAIGGRPDLRSRNYMYEYDPATDIWMRKADTPLATSAMGSVVLGDKIIVVGGWEISTEYPYTTVQVYDTVTDTWTLEEDVPFLRANFAAEVVNNRIYAIGGTDRPHPMRASSTVYECGPMVDFNGDGKVDGFEVRRIADSWDTDDALCDIGPMPWGDGTVDTEDLRVLAKYLLVEVDDPTLIAHYALDEVDGDTATESVAGLDGAVEGGPVWQPEGGMVGGTLLCDGTDDCIETPPLLDPGEGPFSVFAWVLGGVPGQVIISQQEGANWLMADPLDGSLMTELRGPGRGPANLTSQCVVCDGDWHRIGLVWDGVNRMLYVDDIEVAADTSSNLPAGTGGLYLGCGKDAATGTFFTGLIDDVRIYNRAVKP